MLAVSRMLTRDGLIDETWKDKLDTLLGTEEWQTEFYETRTVTSLFETSTVIHKLADTARIVDFVINRLGCTFPAVASNPLLLKNGRGAPLFLLCFAVANKNKRAQDIALKIAEYILGRRSK